MTVDEMRSRYCHRYCKRMTQQWVSAKDDHVRVCIECWRRQSDGAHIEIYDGARMSGRPHRESRPPTLPPPPLVPHEYALRTDLNDALRRIDALERHCAGLPG